MEFPDPDVRDPQVEEARRIGSRLRALRQGRSLSQEDVANLAGISVRQLSEIEIGASDLRVSTVQSLLAAHGSLLLRPHPHR
jgi:transcriptional regulator with XRE-family HTH domain